MDHFNLNKGGSCFKGWRKDILKRRVLKILTDSKSSDRFVVRGAANDSEEEKSQLAMSAGHIKELHFADRIKVGVKELNIIIEDRMLDCVKDDERFVSIGLARLKIMNF